MKKIVRLTEGDLHRIIKNSVNRIIRENNDGNIETAERVISMIMQKDMDLRLLVMPFTI